MSGIYIHIPFCKTRCYYCDFFSSTDFQKTPDFLESLKIELKIQKEFLKGEKIDSIYFGGGTPSVLATDLLSDILKTIYSLFPVSKDAEISIELNPDDITHRYLEDLASILINRLSVGVQSFFDDDLKIMNRRHNFLQAEESVKMAKKTGFENISIDLIYGLPKMDIQKWQKNLDKAFELNIKHLSAYHLTYESETKFGKLLKNKIFSEISENLSIQQFELLMNKAKKNGFTHYEISNFGKPGFFSSHNSNYWKNKNYLGIGPSAHSYNGNTRQWNISNIDTYTKSLIQNKKLIFETETLSKKDKYNEYVITSLRTIWGSNIDYIELKFGGNYKSIFSEKIKKYISAKMVTFNKGKFYLLEDKGKFIADSIIEDLLVL